MRQEIVLSFNVKVAEHSVAVFQNKETGSKVHGDFPDRFDIGISYDSSVKAFVFLIANDGNMSAGKIRKCFVKPPMGNRISQRRLPMH